MMLIAVTNICRTPVMVWILLHMLYIRFLFLILTKPHEVRLLLLLGEEIETQKVQAICDNEW